MTTDLNTFLQPGPCIDSDHSAVSELAASLIDASAPNRRNAITLYYWVRDAIRYNPYALVPGREALKASATLAAGEGWCVPKAALLAALCRAAGIPARVGFADVRNHLSTARLRSRMQSDVFYYHGYCSIFLDGRWVKCTPAFNLELCEKFGLLPLEFDGEHDSLYHPFDQAGNRHMEYLNDRGEFFDIPFEDMMAVFRRHYPAVFAEEQAGANSEDGQLDSTQWEQDVDREVS